MTCRPTVRARLASLAVVLAAGSLTACDAGASTAPQTPSYPTTTVDLNAPSPTSSTSAFAGSTASRDKSFSIVLPVGWNPVKSSVAGVMIFVQAPTLTHDVRTNFNVLRQAAPGATLSDVLAQSRSTLQQGGYTVTSASPTSIGGVQGQGLVATRSVQKKSVHQLQYYVQHGGAIYITTMTSSAADAAAAKATQTAIFGTWAWKSS